jgi:hemolysin activation/secretion protein
MRILTPYLQKLIKIFTKLALCGWACLSLTVRAETTPGTAAGATVATAAAPTGLDIWEYDVDGNTVLDEVDIDRAVERFLGPQRSLDDVDQARAALEKVYQSRGYKTVAVLIPKQTVRDGVVHLQVAEGRIEHLDVVGSQYTSIETLKRQAPSLAEGSVPDFNKVQQDLVNLNQMPDRRVTPTLKAGSAPGTVDVDLVVNDSLPLSGSVELNNRKSQSTSELRTIGSLSYDNLWQAGHSLSLSYQTAPENASDAQVFYFSYLARFFGSPFSLLFNFVDSNSNVATLGGTDVIGKGQVAGVRGIITLPGTAQFYDSVSFGVDYKHFKNRTSLGGSSFDTPVTYLPFSLSYNALWRGESTSLQEDIGMVFASPDWGSSTQEFDNDRYLARGQQLAFHANLQLTHDWSGGTQGLIRLNSQLSDQPLISNEQFPVGGLDSVRGYLEAETLGDYGFSGSGELRSPSFGGWFHFGQSRSPFDDLRLFSFVDGGRVNLRNPLPDQKADYSLASFGGGVSMRLWTYLNGTLDWADPVYAGPATRKWSSRLLFRVWSNF